MLTIGEEEFAVLTRHISRIYGINLAQKKNLIEGRLSNIIIEKGFSSFREYLDFIRADPTGQEEKILISKLTTNHTFFMREAQHFSYFQSRVLPELIRTVKDRDLRVWSAGCSSGQEPYTLAMLIQDALGEEKKFWDSKILATDISAKALEEARRGVYTKEEIDPLPSLWKLQYLKKAGDNYEITEELKREVIFRSFNLMNEVFPFKKQFHTIFCRNVMIYFDQKTKNELVHKFYEHTQPGGYLFIGHSESIPKETTGYRYIMPAVYRKTEVR